MHELAARLGSDVPFFLTSGPQLATGTGTDLEPLDLPQDYWVVLVLPDDVRKPSTADVYDAFDAGDGFDERRAALLASLAAVTRTVDLAALPPNDLATSPLADELRAAGAFRADVSGAGPAVYGLFMHEHDATAAARRFARSREDLGHDSCLVRLSRVSSDAVIDHDSSRTGRWLRPRRVRIALWIAVVESILAAVTHNVSRVTIVIARGDLRTDLLDLGADQGDTIRQVTWIAAASQSLAVVARPARSLHRPLRARARAGSSRPSRSF